MRQRRAPQRAPGDPVIKRVYRLGDGQQPGLRDLLRRHGSPGGDGEGGAGQPHEPALQRRPRHPHGDRGQQLPPQFRHGDGVQRAVLERRLRLRRRLHHAERRRARRHHRDGQLRHRPLRRRLGLQRRRRRRAGRGRRQQPRAAAAPASTRRSATASRSTTSPTRSATSSAARTRSTATATATAANATTPIGRQPSVSSPAAAPRSRPTPASAASRTCSTTPTPTSRSSPIDDILGYVTTSSNPTADGFTVTTDREPLAGRDRAGGPRPSRSGRRSRSRAVPPTPTATGSSTCGSRTTAAARPAWRSAGQQQARRAALPAVLAFARSRNPSQSPAPGQNIAKEDRQGPQLPGPRPGGSRQHQRRGRHLPSRQRRLLLGVPPDRARGR